MCSMRFVIARVSVLICVGFCAGRAATIRDLKIISPTAVATNAEVSYCFDRVRGLDPERLPPAYLVLRVRITVSYSNAGTRPLILPLERESYRLKRRLLNIEHGSVKRVSDGYPLSGIGRAESVDARRAYAVFASDGR